MRTNLFKLLTLLFCITVSVDLYAQRRDIFPTPNTKDVPYRIPALAATKDGVLISVADYRYSRQDIGVVKDGRIDLRVCRSEDNGKTWGDIFTLIEGKGADSPDFMNVAYGDPCIAVDRESGRIMVMSCAGNIPYIKGQRDYHQCIARFYSDDNGKTWSAPIDVAEGIYAQFDNGKFGPARSMFVASGKVLQSRYVKAGKYYRLYCAVKYMTKI